MIDNQIEVKDLSVWYGNFCALEAVSLGVRSGEFVSLVGASGSGKTTLLNALARFVPARGNIRIPGKIGVVFQDYSVFPWMTVAENISFGLEDKPLSEVNKICNHHLKLIRLEDSKDKYPAQLSGGQVQRVSIARALAPNPDVLLMDEPYGALDRDTRERMQKWLMDVWSGEHKTVVFVTHDIEEAIFLADRVLLIKDKRLKCEFPITFPRPRDEEIKFSREFIKLKKEIFDNLKEAN